jgi:hypothetical protein
MKYNVSNVEPILFLYDFTNNLHKLKQMQKFQYETKLQWAFFF